MRKIALIFLVTVFTVLILPTGSMAKEKRFILKTPVAVSTKLPGTANIEWFAKQIATLTKNSVRIKLFQPGALVPPFQIQTAVSKGQVEAGWSLTIYQGGKFPAAPLFSTFPFGPDIAGYVGWYYWGNGQKLLDEFYDNAGYEVKAFPLLTSGMEGGGWFNRKISSIKDIKGLRLRWPGFGGVVLSKLGASVSTIPAAEVFPALEKGAIDGAEFANPVLDNIVGLPKVAKYAYFPGWHQPSTICEFTINKKVWNTMSTQQQEAIRIAAIATNLRSITEAEFKTGSVIQEFKTKPGLTVMTYPDEVLMTFKRTWHELAQELSRKDPFFKKVYDDLEEFMQQQQVWQAHSKLP